MIREIINFTEHLVEDMPEILQINSEPDKGLHVFIDIDTKGAWTNTTLTKDKDYDFYDGKNKEIKLWSVCIKYQEATSYITMNKVAKLKYILFD